MKENLLELLGQIITSLELNEIQSIEVRGAIAEGVKFKSALAVIDEESLKDVKADLKQNEDLKKKNK